MKRYIALTRENSVLTGRKTLEKLYTFQDFPVFMGVTDKNKKEDIFIDMIWEICKVSGIIQLKELPKLELVYQNQHNDGVGTVWQNHYQEFSNFLHKYKNKNILEIGAAHGVVAQICTQREVSLKWTIIEPHPTFKGNKRIKVVKGWFDSKFKTKNKYGAVVHTHVLEHIYEPLSFLEDIHHCLPMEGLHIFSVPNMNQQLKSKFTNCLNFEHTLFLSEETVDYMLKREGFKILRKQYYLDHSIFYATKKIAKPKRTIAVPRLYKQNLKLFNVFVNYHLKMVEDINIKITKSKDPIYLFGAHIFSTYLLKFGLDDRKINGILDNSKLKQGKRLYGTRYIVESPKVLKGIGKVNLILKAGIYNDEIKKDILENINSEVVFW